MKRFQFEGKGNISGDRVRELRLRARLSQSALAAKMTTECVIMEQDVISRIESGARLVNRLRTPRPDADFRRLGGLADRIGAITTAAGKIFPGGFFALDFVAKLA